MSNRSHLKFWEFDIYLNLLLSLFFLDHPPRVLLLLHSMCLDLCTWVRMSAANGREPLKVKKEALHGSHRKLGALVNKHSLEDTQKLTNTHTRIDIKNTQNLSDNWRHSIISAEGVWISPTCHRPLRRGQFKWINLIFSTESGENLRSQCKSQTKTLSGNQYISKSTIN